MNQKNIKQKIKNFFKWIWQECKDWHTLVLLLCVITVVYSPVWGGYLLDAVFGWSWCSVMASAYLLFWAGPVTPFFPLCIGITLSLKKAWQIKKRKSSETAGTALLVKIRNRIFSDNIVNNGRQIELDIAKGLSILFMVWVHTTETFGNYQGVGNMVVEILGGPFAAPVFMVCMGTGLCYARKTQARDLAKRGVGLLVTGLLLNVFRYILPLFIGYALTEEPLFLYTFPFLFGVDIMEFAGLTFLFFALAKRFNWSEKVLAVTAVAASLLGMLLKGTASGSVYIDQFLGYIWGNDNAETYFPFLNWIIFPVFGYLFGKFLRRCSDKTAFYKMVSPVCGILGLGYVIAAHVFSFGMYGENGYYYFLGLTDAIPVLMLVIGMFGFCHMLSVWKDSAWIKALRNMSENINVVYCIQWVLIGSLWILISDLFPEEGLKFLPMTVLAVCFAAVSAIIAHWYQKKKYLGRKPVKVIMACILSVVMVFSVIGQIQAENYLQEEGYDFNQMLD